VILAGDVGGTKTHLALFEDNFPLKGIAEETFLSKNYSSLSEIVALFLKKIQKMPVLACFGVAGPVENGKCKATNLPWLIEVDQLREELKINNVFLINDLEATAWGLDCLEEKEFFTFQPNKEKRVANRALIAAGTGLGEAGLFWDGKSYIPFPSEGGHVDFAPRSELEMELLRYLQKKYGHVSYERVISGPGIYDLYRFLIDMQLEKEPEWLHDRILRQDPPRVITESALKKECRVCVRTVEWFVSLYGGEAGNLALKLFAESGVYIGGGIAPKILPFFKEGGFLKAFLAKGRFSALLAKIEIRIVLNENTALLGAGRYVYDKRA